MCFKSASLLPLVHLCLLGCLAISLTVFWDALQYPSHNFQDEGFGRKDAPRWLTMLTMHSVAAPLPPGIAWQPLCGNGYEGHVGSDAHGYPFKPAGRLRRHLCRAAGHRAQEELGINGGGMVSMTGVAGSAESHHSGTAHIVLVLELMRPAHIGVQKMLETACTAVMYAPLLSVLSLAARMLAIQPP